VRQQRLTERLHGDAGLVRDEENGVWHGRLSRRCGSPSGDRRA
jgi:hypothetical protein